MIVSVTPERVRQWREDTPGCAHVTHFNNAGAALQPAPVLETVIGHLRLEQEVGGYEAAERAAAAIADVPAQLARLVQAEDASEIAITENATRAWDMAVYSIPFAPGDVIVTGLAEFASNYLAYLQLSRRMGVRVEVCRDDDAGQLDLEHLESLLASNPVRVVSITHVPTNGGLVNPALEVGHLARAHGALYVLDACQSIGQLDLDVQALGCDFLSATSRKYLRGPRGIGFLYARASSTGTFEPPFIDVHAATWLGQSEYEWQPGAKRFENWESNIASRLGLREAARYAMNIGLPVITARVQSLADRLRDSLAAIPGITVRDKGKVRCGIVTFTHGTVPPMAIRDALRAAGINTNVTPRTSTRLDLDARGLDALNRASVHYYNTDDEIDQLVHCVRSTVEQA